jgi:branched-chain amino acid transport system permease protein
MTSWQLVQWGIWPPVSWVACIAVALALTLAYGRLIAPHLAWRDTTVKAVATLGFALIVLGLVSFLWIDDPRSLDLPTDQIGITVFGLRVTATRLLAFAGAIAIALAIRAFLGRTTIGLQMRAVANCRDLSALLGIPILRVETIAWGISGLLAGFTGLMFANLIRLEPVVITFMVIPSIAAALTGRLQNLGLVLVGGLTMGVIESLLTLSPTLKGARPIAPFVIAALVLLWTQRGTRLTFGGRD